MEVGLSGLILFISLSAFATENYIDPGVYGPLNGEYCGLMVSAPSEADESNNYTPTLYSVDISDPYTPRGCTSIGDVRTYRCLPGPLGETRCVRESESARCTLTPVALNSFMQECIRLNNDSIISEVLYIKKY
jgi:hypothetical protein